MAQVPPPGKWMFIRFEQGRGVSGVPKMYMPWLEEGDGRKQNVETLVRKAVEWFRAACADPIIGHDVDLMPGEGWDDYHLHNLQGGVIKSTDQVKWEGAVAELILTYRMPNEDLARQVKRSRKKETDA